MTSNNQDKASFQTDYVRLNVEQKDSVLLIELNRPEKYNAFDSLMIQELYDYQLLDNTYVAAPANSMTTIDERATDRLDVDKSNMATI